MTEQASEAPPPGRRRFWARHPRLTALALGCGGLVLADLLLGLALIHPSPGTFRCLHPYFHHGFFPDVRTTTGWGDREYAMCTNSLGFRDAAPREVALEPTGRRILFLGDSYTEGIGVTYEDSFVGQLAARLGSGVEVLNAAAVSYCPMLYRLKLQYLLEVVGLRCAELVVCIDVSDVQDEVNYQSFHPRLPGVLDRARARTQAFLAHTSFSYDLLMRVLRRQREKVSTAIEVPSADVAVFFEGLEAYQGDGADPEKGRWEWTLSPRLMEAWGRRGLELARADMSGLLELCRQHGIALTVCVYPSPFQIVRRDLDSIQVRFWREFCTENGVAFVDLFPTFIGPDAGLPFAVYERDFIAGDTHWNEAGHRRVADELFRHL